MPIFSASGPARGAVAPPARLDPFYRAVAPPRAAPNRTGLPDRLKQGVEALSGFSLDRIRVHYNSREPDLLDANAFARGHEIHVAPGKERHLPHEAWHLVQQARGRVRATGKIGATAINEDHALEAEADRMGSRAASLVARSPGRPSTALSAGSSNVAQLGKHQTAKIKKAQQVANSAAGPGITKLTKSGWNKAKVRRYQDHLTRRGTKRVLLGRPVAKFVRKLAKARRLADPTFSGFRLADAPNAGHHEPAIVSAQKFGDPAMGFGGPRGSAEERSRPRHFFQGSEAQNINAHGIAHIAETLAGLGSRINPNFSSKKAQQFANVHYQAHRGLIHDDPNLGSLNRTPIMTTMESQTDHAQAPDTNAHLMSDSTDINMTDRGYAPQGPDRSDDTDSEPESDEENWID